LLFALIGHLASAQKNNLIFTIFLLSFSASVKNSIFSSQLYVIKGWGAAVCCVLLPPQSLNLLCVIKKLQFNALRSFIDTACGRCKSIHIRIRPVGKQLQRAENRGNPSGENVEHSREKGG